MAAEEIDEDVAIFCFLRFGSWKRPAPSLILSRDLERRKGKIA